MSIAIGDLRKDGTLYAVTVSQESNIRQSTGVNTSSRSVKAGSVLFGEYLGQVGNLPDGDILLWDLGVTQAIALAAIASVRVATAEESL